MKRDSSLLIITGLFLACCCIGWCGPMVAPKPLSASIHEADFVVIAKLSTFTPDKSSDDAQVSQSQLVVDILASYPAGQYTFTSATFLKGNLPDKTRLRIHLPVVSAYYYDSKFTVPTGTCVLLLLKENEQSQLVPVDQTIPFVPLGSSGVFASAMKPVAPSRTENEVISVMLMTLDSPSTRKVNMHLLRSQVDNGISARITPYENDPDKDFRDDVLFCLIRNQQVQAIPLMAQLSASRFKETGGGASIGAFEYLKAKEAVPYLNPLLSSVSPSIRQSAALALRRLADKTSLPYLFNGLEQSDPQGVTLYEEYATLHRLLSRLGTTKSLPAFLDQREATLKATRSWWIKHQQEFMPKATSASSKT